MSATRPTLQKASIFDVKPDGSEKKSVLVHCMFNPYEYTVSKSNQWELKSANGGDVPKVQFKSAGPQALKLKLYFDTYEDGNDVTEETRKLWKLMESKTRREDDKTKKIPPPSVAFHWGPFYFVSVITQMTQKFTLFLPNGTPARAEVDITFTQHIDKEDYRPQNPTSGGVTERVWQVTAGDRIDLISAEVYGDATAWPHIASHNHIVNPHQLKPGQQLSIPPL